MFIIFIYYFLSIATLCACYYFRRARFTEKDYKYNKPLKWTRRILIIWAYLFLGIQISICFRDNYFLSVDNDFIRVSAAFFLITYLFSISWIERVSHPFNNKKK